VRVTLPGGEFVILAILGPGDAVGERALVGDPRPRGATVIALEPCETLSLGRDQFERLRASYPGVNRFLVELLSARVDRLNGHLLEALYVPAERRVLRRLLDLCQLYAGDGQHIVIPVTQDMLASLAGTTRPTANQVLGRLAASQLVEVSRGQILVLNRSELRRRAAGHPDGPSKMATISPLAPPWPCVGMPTRQVSPAEQTRRADGRNVLSHNHSDTGPSPWPPSTSGHTRHTGRGRCKPPRGGDRHGR
jgi:CRP-like cAMP-binding protein